MPLLGIKDLLGKKVRSPKGEYLGLVKGLHQTTCNGCFDEVSIENGHGPFYVPLVNLLPDEEGYILLESASSTIDLNRLVPAGVPFATPLPAQANAPAGTIPAALPAMPAEENSDTRTVMIHNVGSVVPLPAPTISSPSHSLRTQFNRTRSSRRAVHRTTPLVFHGEVRGVVANLEPPKPRDRSRKKRPGKGKGPREKGKGHSTMRGARSLFNISTILCHIGL